MRRSPRLCGRGGQWGAGSPCLGPSPCLPWADNKAGVLGVALAMESVAPMPLRFVLACCPRARSLWQPGVVARLSLSIVVSVAAGSWGLGAGPAPASLPGAAVLPGEEGVIPSASGELGAGAPMACGPVGVWGDLGWGRAVAPHLSLLGGAACSPLPSLPFVAGASPPGVRVPSGSWGSPGRGMRPAAGGRGGGAAREPPLQRDGRGAVGPGGRSALVRPSALPGRATLWVSLATFRSWGARPPHCSGLLSHAAPGPGPCIVVARWCGCACLSRPPREQAVGGAGARGVRVQLRFPPGVMVPSGGGGTPPRHWEGRRAGAVVVCRPGAGSGGERGGGAAGLFPTPLPRGVARGTRPCPPSSPVHPPWVYTPGRGGRAVVGAGRGPVGRQWVSVAVGGGGGRGLLATVCFPAFPRRAPWRATLSAHSWVPPFRCGPRRRRRAAGRQLVMRECAGGRPGALGAGLRSPRLWRPPPGCSSPPGGLRGRRLSGQPPAAHRLGGGGEGGQEGWGGGGGPAAPPWSPGAAPQQLRGGGLVVPVPGGQPPTWGAHSSPAPLYPLGAGPSCSPSLGPTALLAVAPGCLLAGVGGRGGPPSAGGGGSGQRSAISWLRGSGPPLALVAPVLPPTAGGARPSAALYDGGVWVRGHGSAGGGVLRHCPLPTPPGPSPGPTGRHRHLRRRLWWGWGCGGGGLRRR